MKHKYTQQVGQLIIITCLLIATTSYAQSIKFTFDNVQNTNDGSYDYYEADIMIETTGGQADFKLGSGQIYFNYNTTAFGTNVYTAGGFEVTNPNAEGYILGGQITAAPIDIYGGHTINDNTPSRVSWAYIQTFASGTFVNNVTVTPTKLIHIKFKYINASALPMIAFETDLDQSTDQFYTACGIYTSVSMFETKDCTTYPGTQFIGATFDDSEADPTLAVDTINNTLTNLSIYPNPTQDQLFIRGNIAVLEQVDIYSVQGQKVLTVTSNFENINIKQLESALYFVKLSTSTTSKVIKVIKN